MPSLFLQLKTLPTLSTAQQRTAKSFQDQLNRQLTPSENWTTASIHFRPATGYLPDRLIFYPETKKLLCYWSLHPDDDLLTALQTIGQYLPAVDLPNEEWLRAIQPEHKKVRESEVREVLAYWASPYTGESGPWRVRKLILPALYGQIDVAAVSKLLNENTSAPLPPALEMITLSYQAKAPRQIKSHIILSGFWAYTSLKILAIAKAMSAFFASPKPKIHLNIMVTQFCPGAFHSSPDPDEGLFEYLPEEKLLVIEVPLDIDVIQQSQSSPADRQFVLLGSLLAFLGLQKDPGIPGMDFKGWREKLEQQLISKSG